MIKSATFFATSDKRLRSTSSVRRVVPPEEPMLELARRHAGVPVRAVEADHGLDPGVLQRLGGTPDARSS